VIIPVVRLIINGMINSRIEARNMKRVSNSNLLQSPSAELRKKINEASEYRVDSRRISQSDVVYTTEKDALDQTDELSEKFDELEKKRQSRKSREGTDQAPPPATIDANPEPPADDGVRIKLPKYEEFDASP
jgi:hypothetical protein